MLVWENVKLALSGIFSNKLRSVLTMLGIIIGIGSVIAIMTVSASLTNSITTKFAELGANNVTLGVKQTSEKQEVRENGMKFGLSGRKSSLDEEDRISDEMIKNISEKYLSYIDTVALSESIGSGTVASVDNSANISLTGINSGYYKSEDVTLINGRYITDEDVDGDKAVIMISDKVVENIFDSDAAEALGKKLYVNMDGIYYPFYVVGVYEYEENATNFSSSSDEDVTTSAYIPISTGKKYIHTDDGYEKITLVTNSSVSDVTSFADDVEEYINQKYYAANDEYQVNATTMSSLTESMSETIDTAAVAIAFIAGISLLVGGIGVMNIMLVSITERTKEIGTRKALGAKTGSIRFQFIVESMILCLIGGVLGILLGFGIGAVAASVMGYSASAPFTAIAGSVVFSMAIGVFFGFYPANKAAKMDPIEALRYE